MDDERFLYSVYPKKPIKDLLSNGRPINSPKTLSLTKEEVLYCMKSGTVYRRFGEDNRNERVTTLNLDRLHNRKFMTEDEWKKLKEESTVVVEQPKKPVEPIRPTVINTIVKPVVEESKVEEPKKVEPVVEESTQEETVEETTEEVTEDESMDNSEEVVEEETEEEETDSRGTVMNTEAEVTEESQSDSNDYNNRNYYKKKKRH